MEESLKYLKEQFALADVDLKTYSPLTLAYIGDSIYDLLVRTILVKHGNAQVNKLHKRASSLVKAPAQSDMMDKILPHLTEEGEHIYKRGRNAKSFTMAKNATMAQYRRATGFEAVFGYLYLKGDLKRIIDLMKIGIEPENKEKETNGRNQGE